MGIKVHSYVDDNNIYLGFKPIDEMSLAMVNLEKCVKGIQEYMCKNYLKLNISKTQILFCGKPSTMNLYDTRLNEFGDALEVECGRSKLGKTLGVKIDENLKFEEMVKDTCSSGYFKLNKLKNLRQMLDTEIKLTLVKCFILSKIDYCNIVLNLANKKQITPLQKLDNSALRFVYNVKNSANITPFLKRAHILPVSYRIMYKSSLYVFKILHDQVPSYVSELVRRKSVVREGLRSSSDNTVVESTSDGLTVASCMCRTWNNLPAELRNSHTIDTFKKNLKTYYFRLAFN